MFFDQLLDIALKPLDTGYCSKTIYLYKHFLHSQNSYEISATFILILQIRKLGNQEMISSVWDLTANKWYSYDLKPEVYC